MNLGESFVKRAGEEHNINITKKAPLEWDIFRQKPKYCVQCSQQYSMDYEFVQLLYRTSAGLAWIQSVSLNHQQDKSESNCAFYRSNFTKFSRFLPIVMSSLLCLVGLSIYCFVLYWEATLERDWLFVTIVLYELPYWNCSIVVVILLSPWHMQNLSTTIQRNFAFFRRQQKRVINQDAITLVLIKLNFFFVANYLDISSKWFEQYLFSSVCDEEVCVASYRPRWK